LPRTYVVRRGGQKPPLPPHVDPAYARDFAPKPTIPRKGPLPVPLSDLQRGFAELAKTGQLPPGLTPQQYAEVSRTGKLPAGLTLEQYKKLEQQLAAAPKPAQPKPVVQIGRRRIRF